MCMNMNAHVDVYCMNMNVHVYSCIYAYNAFVCTIWLCTALKIALVSNCMIKTRFMTILIILVLFYCVYFKNSIAGLKFVYTSSVKDNLVVHWWEQVKVSLCTPSSVQRQRRSLCMSCPLISISVQLLYPSSLSPFPSFPPQCENP